MRHRFTTEEFIKRAKEIHGDKYDYSKVEYKNNKTKVCIICHEKDKNGEEHGEFWQEPRKHLDGHGCKKCYSNGKKTVEQFITEAQAIYGNKYDYSKVKYKNANEKVQIVCPIHGEFLMTPSTHINNKCGCPRCKGKKLTTEQFIEEVKKVHGDKYDYSNVIYTRGQDKINIICPIHGEFKQNARDHLKGSGCPKCIIDNHKKNFASTKEEFTKKAKKIHGDKYDYSKVEYKNALSKVVIKCPIHGDFLQTPNKHLQGRGCPHCKESYLEKDIRILLEKNNISYEKNKYFEWLHPLKSDFYLFDYNIAIECQGIQHFIETPFFAHNLTLEERVNYDIIKYNKCQKHNIVIIYYTTEENYPYCKNYTLYNNAKVFTNTEELLNYIKKFV